MNLYSTQEFIVIIKHYFKHGESLTMTTCKLRPIFDMKKVPSTSTVNRLIKKFEETGDRLLMLKFQRNILGQQEHKSHKNKTELYEKYQE